MEVLMTYAQRWRWLVIGAVILLIGLSAVGFAQQAGRPGDKPPVPSVLALDINGRPASVGPTTPVPVIEIPQIITTTGSYFFIFPDPVMLPGMTREVTMMQVSVQ